MEAGLALNELGGVYRKLLDFARSEHAIRKALSIFEELGLSLGQAQSWHKLGDLFTEQYQWPIAEEAYAQSIKLKLECFEHDGEAISQCALAALLINVGRLKEAERAANRAWEIVSEDGSPWQKWHSLIRLLRIKVEQGDPAATQGIAARLVEAVRGNPELEAAAVDLRAMSDASDWDGVKNQLDRAGITGAGQTQPPAPAIQPAGERSSPLRDPDREMAGEFQKIDHNKLGADLDAIPAGPQHATAFHDFIFSALQAIFYPALRDPRKEDGMQSGRKRVDIVFNNGARDGFFEELRSNYQILCPFIFWECKNYSSDPANPELDQIAGRFSNKRGKFGIVVCRKIQDKAIMLQRCKDIVNDNRGWVLVLDDDDIKTLLKLRAEGNPRAIQAFLNGEMRKLLL